VSRCLCGESDFRKIERSKFLVRSVSSVVGFPPGYSPCLCVSEMLLKMHYNDCYNCPISGRFFDLASVFFSVPRCPRGQIPDAFCNTFLQRLRCIHVELRQRDRLEVRFHQEIKQRVTILGCVFALVLLNAFQRK